jgi:hypothetical protein
MLSTPMRDFTLTGISLAWRIASTHCKNRLLDLDAAEHPLVLQLGGSESNEMAQCAKIAQDWGYEFSQPAFSICVTKFDNCS